MSERILTAIPLEGGVVRLTVAYTDADLTPERARRLARVLYRAAREAEKRAEAVIVNV